MLLDNWYLYKNVIQFHKVGDQLTVVLNYQTDSRFSVYDRFYTLIWWHKIGDQFTVIIKYQIDPLFSDQGRFYKIIKTESNWGGDACSLIFKNKCIN